MDLSSDPAALSATLWQAVTETIQSIRSIKLHAWEDIFEGRIKGMSVGAVVKMDDRQQQPFFDNRRSLMGDL
jgi:hypothetical protein